MANQNKTKKTTNNYSNSYKHGNYMMISTMLAMCTRLVLMLLSTAFKSANSINMAFSVSKIISLVFFAAFIIMGILSFKKDKSLLEYCIYSFIMSMGFLSLCGTPFFLPMNVTWSNSLFTTRYAQAGITAVNVIYIVWTLVYHGIKSEKKK